jgi:hypothetical protein
MGPWRVSQSCIADFKKAVKVYIKVKLKACSTMSVCENACFEKYDEFQIFFFCFCLVLSSFTPFAWIFFFFFFLDELDVLILLNYVQYNV